MNIQPDKTYWATGNYHEFRIQGEAILDICHSGDNSHAVEAWADKVKELADKDGFKNRPTPESIRRELRERGAWDDDELKDDEQNWNRLLWTAAWDIFDSDEPDHSEPIKEKHDQQEIDKRWDFLNRIDRGDEETIADKEYADRIGGNPWSNF